MCRQHWEQWRAGKPLKALKWDAGSSLSDRFWKKVNKDGPVVRPELGACWVWTASKMTTGYGHIWDKARGRFASATHISWELHTGATPGDKYVCHHCDNPPCVRPDHLFLGTNQDNMHDCVAKGRMPRHARMRGSAHTGAKLTEHDVVDIRTLNAFGARTCDLASEFGVTPRTIFDVVTRDTWTHI